MVRRVCFWRHARAFHDQIINASKSLHDEVKSIPSSVFSWSAPEEGLGKAKGRRMLFVDTSHAANSYNARIVKNAHDDNIAVFSLSDQDTVSVERGDLGHGVFSHVVLRGLGGEAARDQEVRLFGFADFVDRLVRRLTADA
jgi:uncharacterized caspase-like protein